MQLIVIRGRNKWVMYRQASGWQLKTWSAGYPGAGCFCLIWSVNCGWRVNRWTFNCLFHPLGSETVISNNPRTLDFCSLFKMYLDLVVHLLDWQSVTLVDWYPSNHNLSCGPKPPECVLTLSNLVRRLMKTFIFAVNTDATNASRADVLAVC